MAQFHLTCKKRFEAYCALLKKHGDKIGLEAAIAVSNSHVDKCGYCERRLDGNSNLFRKMKGVRSIHS